MKFRSLLALNILLVFAFIGCAKESPQLVPQVTIPENQVTEKPSDFNVFNPRVDILFVIDSSGSMDDVQNEMKQNAYLFADGISKASILDFHIGVTTTDMTNCGSLSGNGDRCGQLTGFPAYVEKTTPNLVSDLSRRMIVGTTGSASEVMFTPTVAALSAPMETGPNKGFYRQDAFLAVIFITDADDQSDMNADQLLTFLNNKKGDANKVLGYGVIRTLKTANSCGASSGEVIRGYLESFLGKVANRDIQQKNILSLCASDYGTKLAEFAKDIVSRSAGTIRLNRLPIERTLVVTYGRQTIPNDVKKGWTYERSTNSILLAQDIEWDIDQGPAQLRVDFQEARPSN